MRSVAMPNRLSSSVEVRIPPIAVDEADVLFLIVQHLQRCGLFASAVALLRESGLDPLWLCGRSKELALLREWVLTGELVTARALLAPLRDELSADQFSAVLGTLGKLQVLEALHEAPDQRQQVVNALHLCARGDRCTGSVGIDGLDLLRPSDARDCLRELANSPDGRWSRHAARLRCFAALVPFFRDDIAPDEDEHRYLTVASDQLIRLIADALQLHAEEQRVSDCISVTPHSPHTPVVSIDTDSPLLLATPQTSPMVSQDSPNSLARSVDCLSLPRAERSRSPTASSESRRPRDHARHPLVASIEWSRARSPAQALNTADELQLTPLDGIEEEREQALDAVQARAATVTINAETNTESVELAVEPSVSSIGLDASTQTETPEITTESPSPMASSIPVTGSDRSRNAKEGGISLTPAARQPHPEQNGGRSDQDKDAELRRSSVASPQLRHPARDTTSLIATSLRISKDLSAPPDTVIRPRTPSLAASSSSVKDSRRQASSSMHEERIQDQFEPLASNLSHDLGDDSSSDDDDNSASLRGSLQPTALRYDCLSADHIVRAQVVAETREAHAVRAMAVHRGGQRLAIGTNARAVRVLDVSLAGSPTASSSSGVLPLLPVAAEWHKHHRAPVYCAAFSASHFSPLLASGDADAAIKVLRLDGARTEAPVWTASHVGKLRALEFAAGDALWSAASGDRSLRCWDVDAAGSTPVLALEGHVGEIQALALPGREAPTPWLLTAALDRTLRLWDARSGRCERLVASGLPHAAFALSFHPQDATLVAAGHQDGSVSLWDLRAGSAASSRPPKPLGEARPHADECRAVAWAPAGGWLLSSSFDGTLCLLDGASSARLQPVASFRQHQDKVLQAAWHPTTPAVLTAGADKCVKLWSFG